MASVITELIPQDNATPGITELVVPSCDCQHAWYTQEYIGTLVYGAVKKTCHRCGRIWIETYL